MIGEIRSESFRLRARSLGAELTSFCDLRGGEYEYIWQRSPAWNGQSPLLFPVVGRLKGGCYHLNGREYHLSKHGFARRSEFALESQSGTEMTFLLADSAQTLEVYPFPFELRAHYALTASGFVMELRVRNTGVETMRFSLGAHPGFLDLWGFGRRTITGDSPADVGKMVVYQLGAMQAVARACGHAMTHVKLHGAMATQAFTDDALSAAIVSAILAVDRQLMLVTTPHNATERAARKAGLRVACEVFADRSYGENGLTLPRHLPDAIIHDPERAASRALQMIEEQAIRTISGARIPMPVHTICVHGDNPQGVAIARTLRERLTAAGVVIRPLSQLSHL